MRHWFAALAFSLILSGCCSRHEFKAGSPRPKHGDGILAIYCWIQAQPQAHRIKNTCRSTMKPYATKTRRHRPHKARTTR
jgi:hypothetical protein